MQLELVRATFHKRYKRFFADCEIDGKIVTAHCPNTGSMKTLLNEGVEVWLRHDPSPHRKLAWTLTLMGLPGGGLALVDTAKPNAIVEEAVREGRIPPLRGYANLRREVKYGEANSRIDLLLESPDRPPCYVEVKNCTMLSDVKARRCDFPDGVSARGRKHLEELAYMVRRGARAVQFFLLSRTDCTRVGLADVIDPAYAAAMTVARAAGVEVLCYRTRIEPGSVVTARRCDFDFDDTVV